MYDVNVPLIAGITPNIHAHTNTDADGDGNNSAGWAYTHPNLHRNLRVYHSPLLLDGRRWPRELHGRNVQRVQLGGVEYRSQRDQRHRQLHHRCQYQLGWHRLHEQLCGQP